MLLLIPVLFPIAAGWILFLRPVEDRRTRNLLVEGVVIANTVLSLAAMALCFGRPLVLFSLYRNITVTFCLDGLGSVFAAVVTCLWPFATLYAFEYMAHEERENTFFAFYTMTYGITLGIAYAGNMMTMYLFYELLTLVTIPLVMHTMTDKARRAGRIYACYSIGGAAFAFTSLIFLILYSGGAGFALGGTLSGASANPEVLRFIYVTAFLGFGVKAAVFPVHRWLLEASVAPTPVTALLHAVAVVKAGVFAILRLTYYCYGTELLHGTWAQAVVMALSMVTVVYGSVMAVREQHFKRRLAWSTISNLSYILMAACLMSPLGLAAAMCHLVAHAVSKICAFFVAGAVLVRTGYSFIPGLTGIGRKMKRTFAAFLVSAMSLTGVPLTVGFISKWQIARAAFAEESALGYAAAAVLFFAALTSGIYMFSVVIRAFVPAPGQQSLYAPETSDPSWRMLVPFFVFTAAMLILGVCSGPLLTFLAQTAAGAGGI